MRGRNLNPYLSNIPKACFFLAPIILLTLAGCAVTPVAPVPAPTHSTDVRPQETSKPLHPHVNPEPPLKETPTMLAAASLVDEGRRLMAAGRLEDAIRAFERAMGIHAADYQACYYLAEAWHRKGNQRQALEFNHLAGLYAAKSEMWTAKVIEQRKQLSAAQ